MNFLLKTMYCVIWYNILYWVLISSTRYNMFCQIKILSFRGSLTGTLAGRLWMLMACQTIWSKMAWNSPIVSRFSLRKELRKLQVTSCLTRLNSALSTFSRSRSPVSSQRFWLNSWILRRTMVQHWLTWWVSVFKT